MADRFFGIERQEPRSAVVSGNSSTATTDIEVRVDTGVNKADAIRQLDHLKDAILRDTTLT